jgi:hypothetical protein
MPQRLRAFNNFPSCREQKSFSVLFMTLRVRTSSKARASFCIRYTNTNVNLTSGFPHIRWLTDNLMINTHHASYWILPRNIIPWYRFSTPEIRKYLSPDHAFSVHSFHPELYYHSFTNSVTPLLCCHPWPTQTGTLMWDLAFFWSSAFNYIFPSAELFASFSVKCYHSV